MNYDKLFLNPKDLYIEQLSPLYIFFMRVPGSKLVFEQLQC